jgi:Protein of unknown function (DUF1501)
MRLIGEHVRLVTRRHFLRDTAVSLGSAALASLARGGEVARAAPDGENGSPRARRVIYLFMQGGPSHLDLWDYKPHLSRWYGQELPRSVRGNQRLTEMTAHLDKYIVAPSLFRFERHGACGTWVSELLPWTARSVDDLCLVRTAYTEEINHDPATTYICTGQAAPGRPSLGAWVGYGLGSLSDNLPTFVVLTPRPKTLPNDAGYSSRLWGAGFLPGKFQGVPFSARRDPILFLNNPPGVDAVSRRKMLDGLARLNQEHFEQMGDPETQTRIEQYEMAFRMQAAVPELTDVSREPLPVLERYGPDVHRPGSFAASCLLARRLAERGVRFVQVFFRGWDLHTEVPRPLTALCREIDQPCHALLEDLKVRGLLEDTLVVWGGEFGRTVYCQGTLTATKYGRDHHPRCFSTWLAGGGVKAGYVHGETDDFSYNIVRDPVHVQDLNATILRCLGLDNRRLTVRHQGLDVRPTGVEDRSPVTALLR